MIILSNDEINKIFLKKKGFIPCGGKDRYRAFRDYFYKPERDLIGKTGYANLFGDVYEEDMVHCKWCEFLGLNPVHPYSYIKDDDRHASCKGMHSYRNSIRTSEELKTSSGSRIIESLLRIYGEESGQLTYNKRELGEHCLETYGGCFMTGEKDFSVDHIKPLIMGYPLTPKNACPLIIKYNSAKRDSWPSEFYNKENLIRLSELSGYSMEELETPKMNYPFFNWCNDNPSVWIDYVMEDRKHLREHGGKENFIESFQKKIDKSINEERRFFDKF